MTLQASPNTTQLLPYNTTVNRPFYMGVPSLTLTITLRKDSGSFVALDGAITEIANGWYNLAYTTVDLSTIGSLAVNATDGGVNEINFCDQVGAPVVLADKVKHGGDLGNSTATFAMANVNFTSASSIAAFHIFASSTGHAMEILGGTSNPAALIQGGTGQTALALMGAVGDYTSGLYIGTSSTNGPAFEIDAGANGPAIEIEGPLTGAANSDFGGAIMPVVHIAQTSGVPVDGIRIEADPTTYDIHCAGSGNLNGYITGAVSPIFIGPGVLANLNDYLKTNTNLNPIPFIMRNSSTKNPEPEAEVSGTVMIDGGDWQAVVGTINNTLFGSYTCSPLAADVNGQFILFRFVADGCDDEFVRIFTNP